VFGLTATAAAVFVPVRLRSAEEAVLHQAPHRV
jgi:hypothetical protein